MDAKDSETTHAVTLFHILIWNLASSYCNLKTNYWNFKQIIGIFGT
jgi:hypothetical protein